MRSDEHRPLTSVIVVAADSGALLHDCVSAVLASDAAVELILMDNASSDGEPQRAADRHANDVRLRLFANASNLGFGAACNRGADYAQGDTLLFLNPDCIVAPDTIARLVAAVGSLEGDALLGVDVRDAAGNRARGNRRRDPTARRVMLSALGIDRWQGKWPALAGIEMPAQSDAGDIERVDAISGACMFTTRRLFDWIGGFAAGFFLHFEDLDMCRRVRDAGATVAILHSAKVRHVQGSSSHHRPVFVSWHKHLGMWQWFVRHDPAARRRTTRLLMRIGIWIHFTLQVPLLLLRKR